MALSEKKLQVIKSLQNESKYAAVSFTPQKHTKPRVLPASQFWVFFPCLPELFMFPFPCIQLT